MPEQPAASRWRSPGAALISALFPGLGQLVLGQPRFAALYFAAAVVWTTLFFRPFRLEQTFYGWISLIFAGWLLLVATCCHALRSKKDRKSPGSFLWLLAFLPLTAIVLSASLSVTMLTAGFRDFRIDGSSMEPVLQPGDVIMADMTFFRTHPIARGDIAVIKSPNTPGVIVLKRVIAIAGDTISGKDGDVFLNGHLLNEHYVEHTGPSYAPLMDFGPIEIPPHKLFLMGDNRDISLDSRMPEFGLIDDSAILGRPIYIITTPHKREGQPLH